MVTSADYSLIAAAVLGVVLVGAVGYYLVSRIRRRGAQLKRELAESPAFADDRAYNQIRLARAELDVLRREGQSVPKAEELLDEADRLLTKHENIDAVQRAMSAHRLLVAARHRASGSGPHDASPPTTRGALSGGWTAPPAEPDPFPTGTPTRAGRPGELPANPAVPPKNRMEAHFQMTLLVEELSKAAPGSGASASQAEAEGLRADAQAAYGRGDYTEALRLALKGRRRLGARLETLPLGKTSVPPAADAIEGSGGEPEPSPPAGGTGTSPCARCGRPVRSDDRFCRSCGAPMTSTKCPRCQGDVTAQDTFCGRCGSPLT